ncbi:MAG TPA: hypothetical protein VNX68_03240 [Nitrosopumilaceae archaeon]|jgi:hypothetical protein|nr:hypothetical protein [Nitrosopumilaceae archaeon]
MEKLEVCFGCNGPVETRRLPFDESWYVKCDKCPAICTLTHIREEDAIQEWNNKWGYTHIKILQAEIERMNKIGVDAFNKLTADERELKRRFEQLFHAYISLKISYSGTWGNLSKEAQRTQLINEAKADFGWQ